MKRVNNIFSQKPFPTGKWKDFCWKAPQISKISSSIKISQQRRAVIYQLSIMRQKEFCGDGDFLCEFCTFCHVNLSVPYILGQFLHDFREMNCHPPSSVGAGMETKWPKPCWNRSLLPPSWVSALGHSQNTHSSWAALRLGYPRLPPKEPPEPFHGARWVLAVIAAAGWHTGRCIFIGKEWEEEETKLWKPCPTIWKIIYKPNNSFAYRSNKKELSFNFMASTHNSGCGR